MVFLRVRQINNELSDGAFWRNIAYDEDIILKRCENFEKKEQTDVKRNGKTIRPR